MLRERKKSKREKEQERKRGERGSKGDKMIGKSDKDEEKADPRIFLMKMFL